MAQLSIIITFYDETAFVEMAVGSVLTQQIDDLEVVLVNDNPERFDGCFFASLGFPDRVKVVHHDVNKGLSAARNTGIAAATGEWIGFLDADDYYTTNGLERQYALAQTSRADITHAGTYLSRRGTPEVAVLRRDRLLFNQPHSGAGLKAYEEAQFITSSWASIYRRDFLDANTLRFDEDQPKFEDRLFVLQTVTAARNIVTLGQPVRIWRKRGGSISVTAPDPYIHRLQIQLLEKCMAHIRACVAAGTLPARFEKRELFNTVSRLIWDLDMLAPIATGTLPEYVEFGKRIQAMLGDDSFGHQIFDDPVLAPISRVSMRTKRGFVSRTDFFDLHRAMRTGAFQDAHAILEQTKVAKPAVRPKHKGRIDKDLILHLGMHKTGSTNLQHHLIHHREGLLSEGIIVPLTGLDPDQTTIRSGGLSGHVGLVGALFNPDKSETWADLQRECSATRGDTVVLSCENMLFPISDNRDDAIELLMSHLKMFRSVRCVAFARRPDAYLESFYKELVGNGRRMGSRTIGEFLVDQLATLTDFPALFGPFEAASGNRVQLLDFDAAIQTDTLWADFCKAIGATNTYLREDLPRYASADRQGTEGARLINALVPNEAMRVIILRDFFNAYDALRIPRDPHPLLAPDQRASLLTAFAETSRDFAATRGYAPDINALRANLPADWSPLENLNADVISLLANARIRAERPEGEVVRGLADLNQNKRKPASDPAVLTLRIKTRPWVRRLINRIKG